MENFRKNIYIQKYILQTVVFVFLEDLGFDGLESGEIGVQN